MRLAAALCVVLTMEGLAAVGGDAKPAPEADRAPVFIPVQSGNRSDVFNSPPGSDRDSSSDLKKRRGKAFARSLLLPGWGQFSEGRHAAGYTFLAAEVGLIAGFLGLRTYGSWLEDDYITYARQHAGVAGDHSHDFYVDIGNWDDRRSFNEQRIRDRNFDRIYTGPGTEWDWDDEASREWFKSLRISSDRARQNAFLFIGGLLLNHIISAVEAGRGVKKSSNFSLCIDRFNRVTFALRF